MPCDREPRSLMLSSWQDWRPEDDLAWFILEAVAQMNLSAIYRTARADGWGAAGTGLCGAVSRPVPVSGTCWAPRTLS